MGAIELTVSDGEETYRMIALHGEGNWYAVLRDEAIAGSPQVYPVAIHQLKNPAIYPTPYACLEALFRAVVTELFGVRA
jgi:hypothetical protein